MKTTIIALTWTVAVTLAVGRFLITPRLDLPTTTGCYESAAHMFVGGLFALGAFCRHLDRRPLAVVVSTVRGAWFPCLAMASALTALEIVVFAGQKWGGWPSW